MIINSKIILLVLISNLAFCQEYNFNRSGAPYYPEQKLSLKDSLSWPIEFEISIDVKEISEINYKTNNFRTKLLKSIWSKYDKKFVPELKNDTIKLLHSEFIAFETDEYDSSMIFKKTPKYYFKKEYPYLLNNDNFSKSVQYIEAPLGINWNFRDFPFDKQELIYRFTSTVDTSIIKLIHSKDFPSSYTFPMNTLKDGYVLGDITTSYEYNIDKNDLILISPNFKRPIVTETLNVIISLKRNGSWLFLKLFIGGIISYLISCLMFLIPKEEFEAKINLAVGSIFGAIGNRYFVDSSLPGIQVLTKADLISNLIIIMIALNILAVILQRSKKINFAYLESENYDFFYSIYYFTIFLVAIILW